MVWCGVAWSVAGATAAAAAAVGYIYACTNMEMNSEIIVGLVCGADWMDGRVGGRGREGMRIAENLISFRRTIWCRGHDKAIALSHYRL